MRSSAPDEFSASFTCAGPGLLAPDSRLAAGQRQAAVRGAGGGRPETSNVLQRQPVKEICNYSHRHYLWRYLGLCVQVGSPNLDAFLEQHAELLKADYALSADGGQLR